MLFPVIKDTGTQKGFGPWTITFSDLPTSPSFCWTVLYRVSCIHCDSIITQSIFMALNTLLGFPWSNPTPLLKPLAIPDLLLPVALLFLKYHIKVIIQCAAFPKLACFAYQCAFKICAFFFFHGCIALSLLSLNHISLTGCGPQCVDPFT